MTHIMVHQNETEDGDLWSCPECGCMFTLEMIDDRLKRSDIIEGDPLALHACYKGMPEAAPFLDTDAWAGLDGGLQDEIDEILR